MYGRKGGFFFLERGRARESGNNEIGTTMLSKTRGKGFIDYDEI